MTCVIVDDEPLALDLLESYVRKTPFLELQASTPAPCRHSGNCPAVGRT